MIKICIAALLLMPSVVFAGNNESLSDHVAASTIKTLAKGFVQTLNIKEFKAKHTQSLLKMDAAKFKRKYARIYVVLKDIPVSLRTKYSITESLSKDEAIAGIGRLTKNDLMLIIDGIPDQAIIKNIKSHMQQDPSGSKGPIFLEQINVFWKKITSRV